MQTQHPNQSYASFIITFKSMTAFEEHSTWTSLMFCCLKVSNALKMWHVWVATVPTKAHVVWRTVCCYFHVKNKHTEAVHHCLHRNSELANKKYKSKSWHFTLKYGFTSLPPQIARFMGPTWGPPGSCRPQMGPMLAPWTLLSGTYCLTNTCCANIQP